MNHTSERPLVIEMIRSSVQEAMERQAKAGKYGHIPLPEPAADMFTIHTANEWMALERQNPIPQMLFDRFWFEGELCILFADTNMGKSILAVQLGNSISRQEPIGNFEINVEPCNVLYIDFELSSKQFELRYTDEQGTYNFGNNFYRAEFNPLTETPYEYKSVDEYINNALEYAIRTTGARVLIIDNITCLRNGTERAGDALPLMKHLKALKTKHNLSMLVLAHTPKRNPANPITRNDLQGSKMLINFADSAFAIGESHTMPGYRYLKQVKQRSSNETYGTTNVCLCQLERHRGFLRHVFIGTAHELDHLYRPTQQQREHLARQIAALHTQGLSQRQIAAKLKVGLATVNKMVNWSGNEVLLDKGSLSLDKG